MQEYSVLFVDDEQSILNSLKRLLLDEDFGVLTAVGGQEALNLLANGERPAVIVSDQRMPGMDGAEFLAQAREISPESIRIMLTGYSDIGAAVDAVNRGGISRYITKPWNDEELKHVIREAYEQYGLIQENHRLTAELQKKNRLLEELNASLEQKVQERTRELQRKIKELEGRDRIQQHLLTLTSLEEALHEVVAVIRDVLDVDAAAIYLFGEDDGLHRAAAEPVGNEKFCMPPEREKILRQALTRNEPLLIKGKAGKASAPQLAVIPVVKNRQPLAVIEAHKGRGEFAAEDLNTIANFGMQAAIAIRDARLRASLPSLEAELDDILLNFKDSF